ncbi:hypothetical protein [Legionella cardiaca]|uniref:Protein IcmL (DotI) n=1 Tax=Legionella cardiaca TaxID=1071983 RepID=A0ABY8AS16_9GAMM|nr:hypothetical protein [Legionella cardiaca]WED43472.1 hypothetical protein PXX05_01485 [Legionella cardiaca]
MRKIRCHHLLLLCALMFLPFATFSVVLNPGYPMDEVSEWTERTLMATLSAGYLDDASEAANVRRHYMPTAWRPMQSFFRDKLELMKERKLTLHPQPVIPATVILRDCEGVSCWRVHQAFIVPELRNKIDFDVLVVTADPAHGSPFLIQSMDIGVTEY